MRRLSSPVNNFDASSINIDDATIKDPPHMLHTAKSQSSLENQDSSATSINDLEALVNFNDNAIQDSGEMKQIGAGGTSAESSILALQNQTYILGASSHPFHHCPAANPWHHRDPGCPLLARQNGYRFSYDTPAAGPGYYYPEIPGSISTPSSNPLRAPYAWNS